MLSLNEIRNVHFRKSNFNGYKSEDVEAFIDEVQESYDQLLRENAELQKKVDVLASKLEEYQHEEDGIRSALINAQKLGDASLRDAKHKAEIILKDATIKAEKIVANAQIEIRREKEIVERMQKDVADFKTNLLKLYKEHLMLINNIRSEDVLRPQTREHANAVHIIDTPFADERYGAPQPAVTDYMQQPQPDMNYMPPQAEGMPYQPMQSDMPPAAQPVIDPYGTPQDFQPVPFEMPVKKEPSSRQPVQGFPIQSEPQADMMNYSVDNSAGFNMDYSAPQEEQPFSGGFTVNMPEEQQFTQPDFSAPVEEAPVGQGAASDTPSFDTEPQSQSGLFKRRRRS